MASRASRGIIVADAARDVEARRVRRDDGKAAFEQDPRGDGDCLARFGVAGDLHEDRLTGGEALDLAQKGVAIGGGDEHAALALHRAVGDGAVNGAGAGQIGIDQQIMQAAIDHQRRGLAPVEVVQGDLTALHVRSL